MQCTWLDFIGPADRSRYNCNHMLLRESSAFQYILAPAARHRLDLPWDWSTFIGTCGRTVATRGNMSLLLRLRLLLRLLLLLKQTMAPFPCLRCSYPVVHGVCFRPQGPRLFQNLSSPPQLRPLVCGTACVHTKIC